MLAIILLIFCVGCIPSSLGAIPAGQTCPVQGDQCSQNSRCREGKCVCDPDFRHVGTRCLSSDEICTASIRTPYSTDTARNTVLSCRNLLAGDTAVWQVQVDKRVEELGRCPPLPANCTLGKSLTLQIMRPSETESTLFIPKHIDKTTHTRSLVLTCTVGSELKLIADHFLMNVTSKDWTENVNDWTMSGKVKMLAFSSLGCYNCTWYQKRQGGNWTTIPASATTTQVTGQEDDRRNVTCTSKTRLPTKDGGYRYSMKPTTSNVPVKPWKKQQLVIIGNPPPPQHNCPALVPEGSRLDCDCASSQPGSPKRRFAWTASGKSSLSVGAVSRNQHGQTFTCQDQSGAVRVNYTLGVAYGPSDVSIAIGSTVEEDLTVACLAHGTNPTPSFSWYRKTTANDTDHVTLGTGPTLSLEVTDVTQHSDTGDELVCHVKNQENGEKTATASVAMATVVERYGRLLRGSLPENSSQSELWIGVACGAGGCVVLACVLAAIGLLVRCRRKWAYKGHRKAFLVNDSSIAQADDVLIEGQQDSGEMGAGDSPAVASSNQESGTFGVRAAPEGSCNANLDPMPSSNPSPYDNIDNVMNPTSPQSEGTTTTVDMDQNAKDSCNANLDPMPSSDPSPYDNIENVMNPTSPQSEGTTTMVDMDQNAGELSNYSRLEPMTTSDPSPYDNLNDVMNPTSPQSEGTTTMVDMDMNADPTYANTQEVFEMPLYANTRM